MNEIVNLSDEELIRKTQSLVAEERRITASILWHLREIERRRVYAKEGYSSLFEYAVEAFGYSEGAAGRRISAMRLLVQIPAIESALRSGELSLSVLSSTQQFLRRAGLELAKEEKLALVQSLKGKSRRECERILAAMAPETPAPDRERAISGTQTEIRFVADEELMQKLERIKHLDAHKIQNPTYLQLFHRIADHALWRLDPTRPHAKRKAGSESKSSSFRYIPPALEREVWKRDGGHCVYVSPGGRLCSSTYRLQVDHIIPVAVGGKTEIENLRLLCRTHNQQAAIDRLGLETMRQYLSS